MVEGVDSTRYWLPAAGKGAGKSEQVRAAQTGAAAEAQGGNAGQQRGNAEQQGGNAGQQRGNAEQQGDNFYAWLGTPDGPAASNPRAQAPPRTGAAQGQAQVLTTWVDLTESDAPHLVESNHQGVFLDPHSCEVYTNTMPPYRRWYWHRASGIWAWEPQG